LKGKVAGADFFFVFVLFVALLSFNQYLKNRIKMSGSTGWTGNWT
jgi:hypothetical protein